MVSSEGWLWVFRAGVGFLLLAALLFLLGYATDHWHDNDTVHYGLWNTCDGVRCSEHETDELPAYHIATQVFQTMAVIFFGLSPIIHLIVYCLKKKKDTGWRSRILDIGYSSGIIFHVCSLLIFGLDNPTPDNFSWSYRMSCASSAIAFSGIVMIIISRSKALYKFTFRSVSRKQRKTAASETTAAERRFDCSPFRSNPFQPPQEKITNSSTSDQLSQSHSTRVPATNVNINININTNNNTVPSNNNKNHNNIEQVSSLSSDFAHSSLGAEPQSSSSSSAYYTAQHHSDTNNINTLPTPPPIVPEHHQPLHPKPSYRHSDDWVDNSLAYTPVDHTLTQVRPAPKSSIAPYTSPTHKKTFGPADRHKTLDQINNSIRSPPPESFGRPEPHIPVPTSSGITPSAPPGDYADLDAENPPPSYSDAYLDLY